MMRTSHAGLTLIKRFEGFSARPYRCPAGYMTIGYGHVVLPGEVWEDAIDEDAAGRLLAVDVMVAERAVMRFIDAIKEQARFDALVSFTFNLGAAALQRSQLRQAVNRGDDEAAARQWVRWVYAGGRVLPGLVARRQAELGLYFSV